MEWKKRGTAQTIKEAILANSRLSEADIFFPKIIPPETIEGLTAAARRVQRAVKQGIPIKICGDYDADGITASAILYLMLQYLGALQVTVRLPKRYSEGYGLSMAVIDETEEGLLITVDNGIAAAKEIHKAKVKGLEVIVLDHHLPSRILPPADVLVDPHVNPDSNAFCDYCGAGLAYKLAELLIENETVLTQLAALAAIGTVADVMPLIGENRVLVRRGLQAMKDGRVPLGLKALMETITLYSVDEHAIGFQLGPMLNAPGRLRDDGAMLPLQVLISDDYYSARNMAAQMMEDNEKRKILVKEGMQRAYTLLSEDTPGHNVPICIHDSGLLAGIAGIVAGRLAEEYRVPAIVLTNGKNPEEWKGSGRSYGGVNLKALLDGAADHLLKYGGHEGAAGLSISPDALPDFISSLEHQLADYEKPDESVLYYDLEAKAENIPEIADELEQYAPFGESNPKPVFKIDKIGLLPQGGAFHKAMGDEKQHIKLFSKDFMLLYFDGSSSYVEIGEPKTVNAIGTLSKSTFQGEDRVELEVVALQGSAKPEHKQTNLGGEILKHLMTFLDARG